MLDVRSISVRIVTAPTLVGVARVVQRIRRAVTVRLITPARGVQTRSSVWQTPVTDVISVMASRALSRVTVYGAAGGAHSQCNRPRQWRTARSIDHSWQQLQRDGICRPDLILHRLWATVC